MINERDVFVVRLKKLATEFELRTSWPASSRIQKEAGELIIAAYNRGYLSLPGLAKLVDWVENPPARPDGVEAWLVPCPENLFMEVYGFHQVQVLVEGERLEWAGDFHGGILPTMLPDSPALNRPSIVEPREKQEVELLKHKAMTCLLLANAIERSSPLDARDRWIYDHAIMGQTWQWIMDNIPDWCPDREQITTVIGVKKAAERYATSKNLPPVPPRRSGRPRNTN